MLIYLIKRLLLAGLTLSVILLASYVLLRCAPGDPARSNMFMDEGAGTSMDVDKGALRGNRAVREKLGLDEPVLTGFARWSNTTINSDASKRYGITTYSGNVVIDNVTLNVKRRGGLAIQGGNVTVSNSNISTYWYAFYVANYNGDTNLTINSGSYVASGYSIIYNGWCYSKDF